MILVKNEEHVQWVEKYRPRTLDQIKGNDKAISTIRKWAASWEQGVVLKKGLILVGDHGTGKTSAAHALANEFKWGAIELNASDARNADNIRRVVLVGSVNETFTSTGEFVTSQTGGRKLIIIDEADYFFERIGKKSSKEKDEKDMSDRGGKGAIIETLRKTKQPVILIVNDLYELTRDSGAAIKQLSEVVKFIKLRQATVRRVLKQICDKENLEITPDALDGLSRHADGDLRSAINDLQLLAEGRKKITFDQLNVLGYRNVKSSIFDALRSIFHGSDADYARKTLWNLDESPEDIILWLDENLPLEYRNPSDLKNGFNILSRADVFLGRIRRRQHYGLWAYAKDLMTAGVALAKHDKYHDWVKYQFPSWLINMSRTKQIRQIQKATALKLGRYCHTSRNVVAQDIMPYFRFIYKSDHNFAVNLSIDLDLDKEEIGWLLEEKTSANKVKYLLSEIKKTVDRQAQTKDTDKEVDIFQVHKDEKIDKASKKKSKKEPKEQADNLEDVNEEDSKPDEKEDKDEKDKKEEKKVQKNLFDY
jgi:replication factor C large subunit